MDKKLQELIAEFNRKFIEAQDARSEVMDYLEEEYEIDTYEECGTIEDGCDWCFGINVEGVERLIGGSQL